MRWLGDYLHARGITVAAPLLPGHGATPEDMNRYRWTAWASHVEKALIDLQQRCRRVFVAGLSLGSMLTLHLAAHHPRLPGIILYSPPLWVKNRLITLTPVARYFIKTRAKTGASDLFDPEANRLLWSYDANLVPAAAELWHFMRSVRRQLPQVTCPTLIFYSTCDGAIHPESAQRTFARLGAQDKQLVTLHECGHCITVDREREVVAARTCDFICSHGG
jgi:carboxylesterase